jgi:hypothetical protein
MIEFAKIVLLGLIAAIGFGVVHDQVTARVCVEYFTIGHPPIFGTRSPTLLALGWGFVGTWRQGLVLAVVTAIFARLGARPPLSARRLLPPLAVLLLGVAVSSLTFGIVGYCLVAGGAIAVDGSLVWGVPPSSHARFVADLWAHRAAYLASYFGTVVLWGWIVRKRQRLAARTAASGHDAQRI